VGWNVSQDSAWQAGSLTGSICCNSPEEPLSKFKLSLDGSRKTKRGETAMKTIIAVFVFLIACVGLNAQESASPEPQKCPMHDAHSQMNERGGKGMGFSQSATTHHFFLKSNGGVIQVEAKDSADTVSRDEIRMHLGHIAHAFQNGDFDIPMFVHDAVPPGVPEMKHLQKQIRYSFEDTTSGGRVVIVSANKDAIGAIHAFLRFQIEEHKTGDPENVR
jgi:hypothetical protein